MTETKKPFDAMRSLTAFASHALIILGLGGLALTGCFGVLGILGAVTDSGSAGTETIQEAWSWLWRTGVYSLQLLGVGLILARVDSALDHVV